jgi:hypothetical protein
LSPCAGGNAFEYQVTNYDGFIAVNQLAGPDPTGLSQIDEGEFEIITAEKTEDVYSARLDYEKKFNRANGVFTVKTGVKFRSSAPAFDRPRGLPLPRRIHRRPRQ